jgi:membrane protease subunit HflK|tara:strand:- start:1025 stop:2095 length:1071 start_codon:yes stop_codon:yes gene_type:complete
MSDEEKQPQGSEPPAEELHDHSQTKVVEDARTRALAEALQSSFKVIRVLMVILAIAFIGSGITKVNENEQALLLRFGEHKKTLDPGLRFAWPYPIDEIVKIEVEKERDIESNVGWITGEDEEPQDSFSFQPDYDGYALTGDGNTIHIKATMNFSLTKDAIDDYVFKFNNVTDFLRSALDNAVYHTAASHSALDAKTSPEKLQEAISKRIDKVIEAHELSITVTSLTLKADVPVGVRPAYEAFSAADSARVTKVDEADGEAKSTLAIAEGQTKVILSGGKTTANRLLTSVEAEAKSFAIQRPFYESNPDLFQHRLVTETMQRVLTNAVDVFYLSGRQPRIWLNRTPAKKKLKEGEAP